MNTESDKQASHKESWLANRWRLLKLCFRPALMRTVRTRVDLICALVGLLLFSLWQKVSGWLQ